MSDRPKLNDVSLKETDGILAAVLEIQRYGAIYGVYALLGDSVHTALCYSFDIANGTAFR